ncbi:VCBS repeat-containing protein [Streptomyces sp. Edi4]|uniref:FG-GAP repeat domain-containing protein n=1 Tax=Streptomyces sp. Edi4 TaxID=3162527 RepID=UPI003305C335
MSARTVWTAGLLAAAAATATLATTTPALAVGTGQAIGAQHAENIVAVGDFDGDGAADLFTSDPDDPNAMVSPEHLSVRAGHKDGSFGSPVTVLPKWGPWGAAVADVNGDGKLDLLSSDSQGRLSLRTGTTAGGFSDERVLDSGPRYGHIVAGDFTGNGKADVVALDGARNLYLLEGHGDGTFAQARQVAKDWRFPDLSAGDVNGDGVSELLVQDHHAEDKLHVAFADKKGGFADPQLLLDHWNFEQAMTGDFNGDGKTDLIAKPYMSIWAQQLWLGNGDGTFGAPSVVKYG